MLISSNVNAAVELVTRMKREGEYQCFRGETRNWMLASALVRRKAPTTRKWSG
jgi:hypothetical protein